MTRRARFVFWAEAGHEVGMGHVAQTVELLAAARSTGAECALVLPPYEPAQRAARQHGIEARALDMVDAAGLLAASVDRSAPVMFVVNHVRPRLEWLRTLRRSGALVAVLDQRGGVDVSADLLINPSIVSEWLRYGFPDGPADCRFGADYAAVAAPVVEVAGRARTTALRGRVLVTMGGVDRTGATARVWHALAPLAGAIETTLVLGPGFTHELEQATSSVGADVRIVRRPPNLAECYAAADVGISAGGHTLYEMACVGLPALVLWEDPHERVQGEAFAAAGCARVVGRGLDCPTDLIAAAVAALLADEAGRREMADRGRRLVDGAGVARSLAAFGEHVRT